jgi:hypothetical protein
MVAGSADGFCRAGLEHLLGPRRRVALIASIDDSVS